MRRLAACLLALLLATVASASGITNMLLGAGGLQSLATTVTAGSGSVVSTTFVGYCTVGVCTVALGSISTSTIGAGTIIALVDEEEAGVQNYALLEIDGFSASPGAAWIGNVTFNGNTFVGSAAAYSYTSGTASWLWTTTTGWQFATSTAYPGTIGYQ